MKIPRSAWAFCCVALGVLLAHATPAVPAAVAATAGLLACAAHFVIPERSRAIVLCFACVAGSWAWSAHRWYTIPPNDVRTLAADEPRTLVSLEGVLLESPRAVPGQRGSMAGFTHFDASRFTAHLRTTHAIGGDGAVVPIRGIVRLRMSAEQAHVRAGDTVRFTGWFTPPLGPTNPGERDFSRLLAERGFSGSVSLARGATLERLSGPAHLSSRVLRFRDALRERARSALPDPQSGPRAALLHALVLGEREAGYDELAPPFTRAGLAHVLAISGMHLGVLAVLSVFLVRSAGDRPRLESIVLVIVLGLLLLLVPARAPILRAAGIALALTAGGVLGRRYRATVMLAWAGVLVLIWKPTELFSPGFQLSFGVVAALVLLVPRVESRWMPPAPPTDEQRLPQRLRRWVARVFIGSFVAWAVSAVWVAQSIGIVSWWSTLTAVIALPAAALALGLGYGAVIVGLVVPGLGAGVSGVLLASAEPLLAVVSAADTLPLSHTYAPALPLAWSIVGTALIVWWLACGAGRGWRSRSALAFGALAFALWTTHLATRPTLDAGVVLRVDVLDVGDGTCWLVRSGDEAVLLDCGSDWLGIGLRTVPDALRALGAPAIERAFVSHDDVDHFAGLLDAADPIRLRRVVTTSAFAESAASKPEGAAAALLDGLGRRSIPVEIAAPGAAWRVGEATITMLAPHPRDDLTSDNDRAMVLLIDVPTNAGPRRALFVGDLEREGMSALVRRHPGLAAHVIEAPHHGSARPFAAEFVAGVGPEVVLQSTGPSRIADPVWAGVRRASAWWSTAEHGALMLEITSDGAITAGPSTAADGRVQ